MAPLRLRNGVIAKEDRPVLVVPLVHYGEIVDTISHHPAECFRQPSVLILMIEVRTAS